jgi:hypothetical protein
LFAPQPVIAATSASAATRGIEEVSTARQILRFLRGSPRSALRKTCAGTVLDPVSVDAKARSVPFR